MKFEIFITIFQDFVVDNTLISDIRVWPSNQACLEFYPEEGNNCTHVRLVLDVYLRVEIAPDTLLAAVSAEFQREPLVQRLFPRLEEQEQHLLPVFNFAPKSQVKIILLSSSLSFLMKSFDVDGGGRFSKMAENSLSFQTPVSIKSLAN